MSAGTIKPCPCCGLSATVGIDIELRLWGVLRRVCCSSTKGGCGAQGGLRDTKREAIRAWNRRAASNTGGKP